MFTGIGLGVGKGSTGGGSTAVGLWPIWVGRGSDVTVTGVGAEPVVIKVRVGSTVFVGTSVKSSCCCGSLVRLHAAMINTNMTHIVVSQILFLPNIPFTFQKVHFGACQLYRLFDAQTRRFLHVTSIIMVLVAKIS